MQDDAVCHPECNVSALRDTSLIRTVLICPNYVLIGIVTTAICASYNCTMTVKLDQSDYSKGG